MITSKQIRMSRAALGWSLENLANVSRVSVSTLKRIETEAGFRKATSANLSLIRKTLEEHGIEFVGDEGNGPGVRLWKQSE